MLRTGSERTLPGAPLLRLAGTDQDQRVLLLQSQGESSMATAQAIEIFVWFFIRDRKDIPRFQPMPLPHARIVVHGARMKTRLDP